MLTAGLCCAGPVPPARVVRGGLQRQRTGLPVIGAGVILESNLQRATLPMNPRFALIVGEHLARSVRGRNQSPPARP